MVMHLQVVQFLSGGIDGVWFTEGGLEGLFKCVPVMSKIGELMLFKCEVRLIPVLGSSLKPGHSISDLDIVIFEVIWTSPKYEFALSEEST